MYRKDVFAPNYDQLRRKPHYCNGMLGGTKRKHKLTLMFHSGNAWSGIYLFPLWRCPVCGFRGFSSAKPPKR